MGRGVFSDVLGLLTGPRAQSSGLGARCWGGASVREKGLAVCRACVRCGRRGAACKQHRLGVVGTEHAPELRRQLPGGPQARLLAVTVTVSLSNPARDGAKRRPARSGARTGGGMSFVCGMRASGRGCSVLGTEYRPDVMCKSRGYGQGGMRHWPTRQSVPWGDGFRCPTRARDGGPAAGCSLGWGLGHPAGG